MPCRGGCGGSGAGVSFATRFLVSVSAKSGRAAASERDMKIHEYQARQILSENGIAVPPAEVVRSPDEAVAAFKKFGGQMCVVKAQVYAGGRGKAGFVKLV